MYTISKRPRSTFQRKSYSEHVHNLLHLGAFSREQEEMRHAGPAVTYAKKKNIKLVSAAEEADLPCNASRDGASAIHGILSQTNARSSAAP